MGDYVLYVLVKGDFFINNLYFFPLTAVEAAIKYVAKDKEEEYYHKPACSN